MIRVGHSLQRSLINLTILQAIHSTSSLCGRFAPLRAAVNSKVLFSALNMCTCIASLLILILFRFVIRHKLSAAATKDCFFAGRRGRPRCRLPGGSISFVEPLRQPKYSTTLARLNDACKYMAHFAVRLSLSRLVCQERQLMTMGQSSDFYRVNLLFPL